MRRDESNIEKIIAIPARILQKGVAIITKKMRVSPRIKKVKRYWYMLGPGLTTGAADDDPSGIITYSQTGARFGFQLLWLAAFTFPLMAIIQEMCARIGLVTGRGLAANIRLHFPKPVMYACTVLLLIANTFNIGADLAAMAEAMKLIFPKASFVILILGITALSLGVQIFLSYAVYASYLKYLSLILFAYILSALLSNLDWKAVAIHSLLPTINFDKEQILLICAILGTTISPYLFFWQTSQEMEEEILLGKKTIKQRQPTTNRDIKHMRIDIWSGMFFSNCVMFFIIAVCAGNLFKNGITNIETPAQAAEALRPLAGEASYLLFVIGIIGTGLLALPVLAGSSAYALAESFGWKNIGLYRKLKTAPGFYGVIMISMLGGLAMNFFNINPIKALIWSAILNGLSAPVVLILIVSLSSNPKVMRDRVNSSFTKWIGYGVIGIMCLSGIAAIIAMF